MSVQTLIRAFCIYASVEDFSDKEVAYFFGEDLPEVIRYIFSDHSRFYDYLEEIENENSVDDLDKSDGNRNNYEKNLCNDLKLKYNWSNILNEGLLNSYCDFNGNAEILRSISEFEQTFEGENKLCNRNSDSVIQIQANNKGYNDSRNNHWLKTLLDISGNNFYTSTYDLLLNPIFQLITLDRQYLKNVDLFNELFKTKSKDPLSITFLDIPRYAKKLNGILYDALKILKTGTGTSKMKLLMKTIESKTSNKKEAHKLYSLITHLCIYSRWAGCIKGIYNVCDSYMEFYKLHSQTGIKFLYEI